MVAEAQFIIGLENETPESIEDTYRWALDWDADMVNWNMYTPWPFSDLFSDLGDKVEVRDYAKYNFVTPIMKPDAMSRSDVLNGVMKNYKRFYMRKSFLSYPWIRDPFKRKYMLGCLKAFLKSTVERRFYDLGRIGYRGQKEIDFQFDPTKVLDAEQLVQLRPPGKKSGDGKPASASVMACGGSPASDVHRALAREAPLSEPIDEFFDPRGFARQRAKAKHKGAAVADATETTPANDPAS
jgi:anaerobic magnesium-protoporphyrin IX monomethyl ester cyclase